MVQVSPPRFKRVVIPFSKALHFRVRSHKNNPEGRALLRNAYRSWYFAKRLQEIEVIGVERNIAGMPVMEVPLDVAQPSTPEARSALASYQDLVRKVRVDKYVGVVVPASENHEGKTGYKFSLMSASGKSTVDTDPIIRRYESRIAMSVLGEFIMLGMDKVGSFALSSTKTELFAVALSAIADDICEVFNRTAIPRLMRLNGVPQELWPELRHGDIEQADINQLMGYVVQGVQSGAIVPDETLDKFMREYGSLPARESTESLMTQAAQAAADDDAAGAIVPGATTTQEISLNGAQITSLLAVIQDIAARRLPRESGVEIIRTSFQLDRARADALVGDVGRTFFVSEAPPV
jgi:hypothetical protein